MNTIKILPLVTDFITPKRASDGSAAYDAFLQSDYKLQHGRQIIPLGFSLAMPQNILLDNRTRAGYAAFGLKAYTENNVEVRIDADVILGLIDSDYRQEVGCILIVRDENVKYNNYYLKRGQAVSQLLFQQVPDTAIVITDSLDTTSRIGGFGKQNNEHITQDNKQ